MATTRRLQRLRFAAQRRQTDLIVALDQVHDRHNVSAILRTADAVGVPEIIWMPDPCEESCAPNPEIAQGAERWVSLRKVENLQQEIRSLAARGYRVAATHLGAQAVDFRAVDWTTPWVVVMGNERRGCSDEILEIADVNVYLPMVGLVRSLNVSVATAVILFEIQRQREKSGGYSKPPTFAQIERFHREWGLSKEGIKVEDLFAPASEAFKEELCTHIDGRNLFVGKLRMKKEST